MGSQPIAPSLPPSSSPLRLLLVDDHLDTLLTMKRLLASRGFEVCAATTIAEALHLFRSQPFDVVLSDITFPDGNGYELMAAIRETSKVPSIAVTGHGMALEIAESVQAGFTAHLMKPFTLPALLGTIAEAVAKSES